MSDRILVVDDEEPMQFMLREALTARGFETDVVPDAETALERLRGGGFALVVLDIVLPGLSGMDALPRILRIDPHVPVIMMTAQGSRAKAVQAIQAGAYDFFVKPVMIDELTVVIRRALEKRALSREVENLNERLDTRLKLQNLIGQSGPMRNVAKLVSKVVASDVTVLIHGESGTGKELVAEAIHHNSPRRARPFVKLNCTAIAETLLENELFGHEKGSFTGANERRIGKFEQAHTGTILLDEIGDMSMATQAKILRVLQQREFERVGGTATIPVDVRILASTNKDLDRAVQEGRFREDLYYRLNVFAIRMPPLRERKDDIPLLVEHFIRPFAARNGKKVAGFSAEAMEHLLAYDWPGNVRELVNYIERAVLMAESEILGPDCLPPQLLTYVPRVPEEPAIPPGRSLDDALDSIENKLICSTLRRTGGVQIRAAKLLGITERSLWHRVKKLGINVEGLKEPDPEP